MSSKHEAYDISFRFTLYYFVFPFFQYLIPHDWVYEQLFFASRNNNDISYIPRLYKGINYKISKELDFESPFCENFRKVLKLSFAKKLLGSKNDLRGSFKKKIK